MVLPASDMYCVSVSKLSQSPDSIWVEPELESVVLVEIVAVAVVLVVVGRGAVVFVAAVVVGAAVAAVAAVAAAAALLRLLAAVLAAAIPTTSCAAFRFCRTRQLTTMLTFPRRDRLKRSDMTTTVVLWSSTGRGHSSLYLSLSELDLAKSVAGEVVVCLNVGKTLTGVEHLGTQDPRNSDSSDAKLLVTGTMSAPMIPTPVGMLLVAS